VKVMTFRPLTLYSWTWKICSGLSRARAAHAEGVSK
jgi:hypothetical protein